MSTDRSIDVSRPAVAIVMTPTGRTPRIVPGFWQPDGTWADTEAAADGGGLADAITEKLRRASVTVICQSFNGRRTQGYHYNAQSPAEDGTIRLPLDPDYDPTRELDRGPRRAFDGDAHGSGSP
jgi:hypothetical protein